MGSDKNTESVSSHTLVCLMLMFCRASSWDWGWSCSESLQEYLQLWSLEEQMLEVLCLLKPNSISGKCENSVCSYGSWIFWALNDRCQKYAGCRLANSHSCWPVACWGPVLSTVIPQRNCNRGMGFQYLVWVPSTDILFYRNQKNKCICSRSTNPKVLYILWSTEGPGHTVLLSWSHPDQGTGARLCLTPYTLCQPPDSTQPVPCHEG